MTDKSDARKRNFQARDGHGGGGGGVGSKLLKGKLYMRVLTELCTGRTVLCLVCET